MIVADRPALAAVCSAAAFPSHYLLKQVGVPASPKNKTLAAYRLNTF